MSRKKPLLSDVLEELKTYKEGLLLGKTISIFEDTDSERVTVANAELRDLNSKQFNAYKVMHYYQLIFNPEVIEIYVEKIKD